MKYPQKYGRPGISTTYCSDTVMPYIIKTQSADGQRDASALELTKNFRGIVLTSLLTAKIDHTVLRNCIEHKIENILRKNQNGFRKNRSTASQILIIRRILEGVRAKNLQAISFIEFT